LLILGYLKTVDKGDVNRNHWVYRFLEVVSTAGLGWLHGANDAQKTMGIIGATLLSAGYVGLKGKDIDIPLWVVFACHVVIAVGTFMGGWSIIGKMALDIYPNMQRTSGLCANIGAITALETCTALGLPVSTTHLMNFGILAAGVGDGGVKGVRWRVMGEMIACWIFTIPVAIFLGFALASMMLLPGAWAPFFLHFLGSCLDFIHAVLFVATRERTRYCGIVNCTDVLWRK